VPRGGAVNTSLEADYKASLLIYFSILIGLLSFGLHFYFFEDRPEMVSGVPKATVNLISFIFQFSMCGVEFIFAYFIRRGRKTAKMLYTVGIVLGFLSLFIFKHLTAEDSSLPDWLKATQQALSYVSLTLALMTLYYLNHGFLHGLKKKLLAMCKS
jgi:magnesium-transporting ATPase (P-type)